MSEHKGKPNPRWNVQPLQTVEGDVPPVFHVPALPSAVLLKPTDDEAELYLPVSKVEGLVEAARKVLDVWMRTEGDLPSGLGLALQNLHEVVVVDPALGGSEDE